jgi:hypothetical protein
LASERQIVHSFGALIVVFAVVLAHPSNVVADAVAVVSTSVKKPPRAKKDIELGQKESGYNPSDVPVAGVPAKRLVNLYNSWTDEWLAVDPMAYWTPPPPQKIRRGRPTIATTPAPAVLPPKPPQDEINRFLRCHYTNEQTNMTSTLERFPIAAALYFGVDAVHIVSGFRHPKYNLMLRKKGHQVARESEHTRGNAIDFRLVGVTTRALHYWAVRQRRGGVGRYMESQFVHMDIGPLRYWNGD